MDQLTQFLFVAVLIEAVVTTADNVKERYTEWKFWLSWVLGLAVGILVAVNYNVDLFTWLGLEGQVPIIGAILTGIVFGRGSNYVADIMTRIQGGQSS